MEVAALEGFENVTEEEILTVWHKMPSRLSEDEVWSAIVTGIALDMALGQSKQRQETEQ